MSNQRIPRRSFISSIGTAVVALSAAESIGFGGEHLNLAQVEKERFDQWIGTEFQLTGGEAKVASRMRLLETKRSSHSGIPGGRQPFSLLFRIEGNTLDEQATFHVKHRDMGSVKLFLLPVGGQSSSLCEAIFS